MEFIRFLIGGGGNSSSGSRIMRNFFALIGMSLVWFRFDRSGMGKFARRSQRVKRRNKTMACNYATRKSAWSSCGIDRNIKAAKVYTCNVLSRPDDNILFALSHHDYANSGSTVSDKRGGLVVTEKRLQFYSKKIHIPFVSIVSPHEESEEPFVFNDRHEF